MNSPASTLQASTDGPLLVIHASASVSPLTISESLLESEFRRHGALLLRGFDVDVETFGRFADRLCIASVFNESPNRALIDATSNMQTVNLGTSPFPLHPELSREPWRPDVCLFACFNPPTRGGETTVCDGVEIVRRLPTALVEEMLRHALVYRQRASRQVLEYWLGTATPDADLLANPPPQCPYWFTEESGTVMRSFSRPFLHTPMFHHAPAFGNHLLFARLAHGASHYPVLENDQTVPDDWVAAVQQAAAPITYALQWQRGDILILDNSRFMHGRREILNAEERKIASYFGYLRFAPPNEYDPPEAPWRRGPFRPPPNARQQGARRDR